MEQENADYGQSNPEFLVGRIKEGDKEAFMKLVGLYQQKIYVLAYSMVREREDALDLVQETFLRLYEKINSYRSGENFNAWLMKIARNICIDFIRRQKARKKESLDNLNPERLDLGDGHDDPSRFNPGELIHQAVVSLPAKQQAVFILHHYQELKYVEIAEELKISTGTVKSLHYKAVRKLRKLLARQLGGEA
ncbi:MAG TPA: RNA polymerase sigma factor [Candidatus Saccharicenans sp.]|jgi:RNA polymerase sigma-70 factor (ECF subfamily)|nr:RNA polymerase sigma factor [Candidatus Saccharicenans sp.]HRD01654.1 RNA polymerase sigma factor [Candidatus Saccharicenans sp.]